MVNQIGAGVRVHVARRGLARYRRRRLGSLVAYAGIALGTLGLASCGLFDTEYEPVQKGQAVPVDGQVDRVNNGSANIPLPTAGPNGVTSPEPSGVSGAAISPGTTNASDQEDSSGSTGASGGSAPTPNTGGSGGTAATTTMTTAAGPVIATVVPEPSTVPMNVPPETAEITPSDAVKAFCDATSNLTRVGTQLLHPSASIDLAHYRALMRASLQYILLIRDSYPDPDRSVFTSVLDAAAATEGQLNQLTTIDATLSVVQEFTDQQEGPFTEIYAQRTNVCTGGVG